MAIQKKSCRCPTQDECNCNDKTERSIFMAASFPKYLQAIHDTEWPEAEEQPREDGRRTNEYQQQRPRSPYDRPRLPPQQWQLLKANNTKVEIDSPVATTREPNTTNNTTTTEQKETQQQIEQEKNKNKPQTTQKDLTHKQETTKPPETEIPVTPPDGVQPGPTIFAEFLEKVQNG